MTEERSQPEQSQNRKPTAAELKQDIENLTILTQLRKKEVEDLKRKQTGQS